MTNRPKLVDFAGGIDAILLDYVATYPGDSLDASRDSKRVRQALQYRGLQFITEVLPTLADALQRGLADGRLPDTSGIPFGGHRSKRIHVPRIFSGLWLRVFTEEGLHRKDADPTSVAFLLTLLLLGKKLELETPRTYLKEVYNEYIRIDAALPRLCEEIWSPVDGSSNERRACGSLSDFHGALQRVEDPRLFPILRGYGEPGSAEVEGSVPSLLAVVQQNCDVLSSGLGSFDPSSLHGRHGPGAIARNPTSGYKGDFVSWSSRLDEAYPYSSHALLNEGCGPVVADSAPAESWNFSQEDASVLLHVPKTKRTPRLIAKEPGSNQWCQQALATELHRRVKLSNLGMSIDFNSQLPSQEACRLSSVNGNTATIDLSSASDRLSCAVIQRVFRGNLTLLRLLAASRTLYCRNGPLAPFNFLIKLRKFATQGSALTFPVQSIVFTMLAVGVGCHVTGTKPWSSKVKSLFRKVRVYGDDIIVPVDWVVPLTSVLEVLGLKVNLSKSFWEGNFRESCGLYAYKGYDVTPMRIRHHESTDAATVWSFVEKANDSFLKGYWNLSTWIERTVLQGLRLPAVDRRGSPVSLITNSVGVDDSVKRHWDRHLHCWSIEIDRFFGRKVSRSRTDGLAVLLEIGDMPNREIDEARPRFPLDCDEPPLARREIGTLHLGRGREAPALIRRRRVSSLVLGCSLGSVT